MDNYQFSKRPLKYARMVGITALALISGCASVHLPLCPRIASLSYDQKNSEGADVNKHMASALRKLGISSINISSFEAEYHGTWRDIHWLESNYPALICSFSPHRVIDPKAVHTACLERAPGWIMLVKQGRRGDLFLDEYGYKSSCYPRSDGT